MFTPVQEPRGDPGPWTPTSRDRTSISYPISGKFLEFCAQGCLIPAVAGNDDLGDLLTHLERVSRSGGGEVEKIVHETLAYFAETVEQFVARRHAELQAEELKNDAIFERIQAELRQRRFAAPELSARQIRRLVYG